jgi:hypothetical protein
VKNWVSNVGKLRGFGGILSHFETRGLFKNWSFFFFFFFLYFFGVF